MIGPLTYICLILFCSRLLVWIRHVLLWARIMSLFCDLKDDTFLGWLLHDVYFKIILYLLINICHKINYF